MKKSLLIMMMLVAAVGVSACTSESTSTTTVDVTTTTDEGTKEYSYKSENNNGDVTTETNVTETPAGEEGAEEVEIDEDLMGYAENIDATLSMDWDDDESGHDVSCDPDTVYVHVWSETVMDASELNEDEFREQIIPSWEKASSDWQSEMEEEGIEGMHVCFQYLAGDKETVIFTVEDGKITYFVKD